MRVYLNSAALSILALTFITACDTNDNQEAEQRTLKAKRPHILT